MTNPWTFTGEPTVDRAAGGSSTLVEGATFVISAANGDVVPGGANGLFYEDTRFLSCWRLLLDQAEVQSLASYGLHPFAATFLSRGRPRPGQSDSTLLLERRRSVGSGMREDILLRNLGPEPARCSLSFEIDADFAHLFEVKENKVRPRGEHRVEISGSTMTFSYRYRKARRRLEVTLPSSAMVTPCMARIDVDVPAGGEWHAHLELRLFVDDEPVARPTGTDGRAVSRGPLARLRSWEEGSPRIETTRPGVNGTFWQASRDLGALRIFDPGHPDRAVVAAGAPWFMTLFGRDSLITSILALAVDPSLATSTLLTLAHRQGRAVDELTEEEPGKILHEIRRGLTTVAGTDERSTYYGSIDATPLFVMALGERYRWGMDDRHLQALLPHADRAIAWIDDYGDRDGDGFVEYQRTTPQGLANQGWKDSYDGVSSAAGRLAGPPIALCEVQGYTYRAYLDRALIADGTGDPDLAARLRARADRLKERFDEHFWLKGRGYYAMGLDGDKQPIDALASNMGHCLWAGIVADDKAERVAERLCGPELFSGWGIRTLATSMARYNPVSYHNGSVWPHDNAICAAGLARYGLREQAEMVTVALFEAAEAFGGRLPELFCGFDRHAYPVPVPYPSSCSPQAWSAAAPFGLLRSVLLGLQPDAPDGTLACNPSVPAAFGTLAVRNLPVVGARLAIETMAGSATVRGLPDGIRLVPTATPMVAPASADGSG